MSKTIKVLIIIVALLILVIGGFFIYQKYFKSNNSSGNSVVPANNANKTVSIPNAVLSNKFGFLSGGPESYSQIKDYGAAWVRPHPGPFLWDAMQQNITSDISFENSDELVKTAQENQLGTLATLWPFAEWDQKNQTNSSNCAVSENDEFLPKNDQKGRGDYLPAHRCAPFDWDKYYEWLRKTVERYDGDGISDMPGLEIPIKYWEVMNEPDLQDNMDGRLTFWRDSPEQYAKLLIESSKIIKQADPDAQVLIAGAAGGNPTFLDFYRKVFSNKEALTSFDLGNVHCISNDENNDFNVSAYKKMLSEFGINKDVWVTEAENMKGTNLQENFELTKKSTEGAILAGAKRIFYTRYDFADTRKDMSEKNEPTNEQIKESQNLYKSITEEFK